MIYKTSHQGTNQTQQLTMSRYSPVYVDWVTYNIVHLDTVWSTEMGETIYAENRRFSRRLSYWKNMFKPHVEYKVDID